MKRLLLALSLVTVAAQPALADHGTDIYRWSDRHVILEDRTGIARMRDAGANAVARWNATGAAITVTYRVGPATNACRFEGNVVSLCTAELHRDGVNAQTPIQVSGPFGDKTITGAFIQVEPVVATGTSGTWNLRGIVAHETGHGLCCYQHSQEPSIMNELWTMSRCGYECEGPLQHDADTLIAIYGPAATTVTAGSTWYSSGAPSATVTAGGQVTAYATGAFQGVPYRLTLGTAGCAATVRVLNPTAVMAGSSGLIARVTGTVPAGTPPGAYTVCFNSGGANPTATSPRPVTVA